MGQQFGIVVVIVHHITGVMLHGIAAGALMKYGFNGKVNAVGFQQDLEIPLVLVVGNIQGAEVGQFLAALQIIHHQDIINAFGIETSDNGAADETGASSNNIHSSDFLALVQAKCWPGLNPPDTA